MRMMILAPLLASAVLSGCGSDDADSSTAGDPASDGVDRTDASAVAAAFFDRVIAQDCGYLQLLESDQVATEDTEECSQSPALFIAAQFDDERHCPVTSYILEEEVQNPGVDLRFDLTVGGPIVSPTVCEDATGNGRIYLAQESNGDWAVTGWDTSRP